MASADLVIHKFVAETTIGVTPTSPALTKVNVTSSSIDGQISSTTSNLINANRCDSDSILTELGTSGDLGVEWQYSTYDAFLESALGGTFATTNTVTGTDISASATDQSYNSAAGAFSTALTPVGSFAKATGFSGGNSGNNGKPGKIVSITPTKMVLSGLTIVDDAAGESVTIKGGSYLRNASTRKSFTIEKEFADLTTTFVSHKGCVVNSANINAAVGSVVNGSFSFNGLTTAYAATTVGTGTEIAATSNEVFSPVNGVGYILEAGTALSNTVRGLNLTTNNNLRPNQALGSSYPFNINLGSLQVTGTIEAYFTSYSLLTKALNSTETSLIWYFTDADGNVFVIDLPSVKYTAGTLSGINKNSDIMISLNFTAFYNSTSTYAIQISSLAA